MTLPSLDNTSLVSELQSKVRVAFSEDDKIRRHLNVVSRRLIASSFYTKLIPTVLDEGVKTMVSGECNTLNEI